MQVTWSSIKRWCTLFQQLPLCLYCTFQTWMSTHKGPDRHHHNHISNPLTFTVPGGLCMYTPVGSDSAVAEFWSLISFFEESKWAHLMRTSSFSLKTNIPSVFSRVATYFIKFPINYLWLIISDKFWCSRLFKAITRLKVLQPRFTIQTWILRAVMPVRSLKVTQVLSRSGHIAQHTHV